MADNRPTHYESSRSQAPPRVLEFYGSTRQLRRISLCGDMSVLAAALGLGGSPWCSVPISSGESSDIELCPLGLEPNSLLAQRFSRSAANALDRIYMDYPVRHPCRPYLNTSYRTMTVPSRKFATTIQNPWCGQPFSPDPFQFEVNRHHAEPSWVPTFADGTGGH